MQSPQSDVSVASTISSSGLSEPSLSCGLSINTADSTLSGLDKEKDFFQIDASPPIDLECQIQAERIEKILTDTLWKTKISIALPSLVPDLHGILTPDHYSDLIDIFELYERRPVLLQEEHLTEPDNVRMSRKYPVHSHLGHLIYILNSYKELKPMVEQVVSKMKDSYLQENSETRKHNAVLEYLCTLEKFNEIMMKRVRETAEQELTRKLKSRKIKNSNDYLISRIKDVEMKLKSEENEFLSNKAEKFLIIKELQRKVNSVDKVLAQKLKNQVLESECKMLKCDRAQKVKLEILKEQEADLKHVYEQFLSQSLEVEKSLRLRKSKVERQLQNWVQKYDIEMIQKQSELDEYINLCNEANENVKKLKKALKEQNKMYGPLIAEREEEYAREMAKKMIEFRHNHAARVIQNAWKQVLENRQEMKKLKVEMEKRKKSVSKRTSLEKRQSREAEREAKKQASKTEARLSTIKTYAKEKRRTSEFESPKDIAANARDT